MKATEGPSLLMWSAEGTPLADNTPGHDKNFFCESKSLWVAKLSQGAT